MRRAALTSGAAVLQDERGTASILALFLFMISAVAAGLAIDFNNVMARRTKMQAATESVAHAAIYHRERNSVSYAKSKAMEIAGKVMPSPVHGDAIKSSDIIFGIWDADSETFTADANSRDAVQVDAVRKSDRANTVKTFLLRMIGHEEFQLQRSTVYETFIPSCLREGLVAEGIVEVKSDNLFKSGYCIHSNTFVQLQNFNTFEPNTIVSMPDIRNLVEAGSNPGLSDALRDAGYQLRVLERVDDIVAGIADPSSPYYRDYILGASSTSLSRTEKLDSTKFTPGGIYTIPCATGTQTAKIHAGTVLSGVVIITNCEVFLGENVRLEDATVISTSTSAKAVSGASGVTIGLNDNCAPGGGAQIVTNGGIDFPQYIKLFGGQMIAKGDILFTSDANGIEGGSMIAGGQIRGTTGMTMAFCGGAGMEHNFEAKYFRIAQSAS